MTGIRTGCAAHIKRALDGPEWTGIGVARGDGGLRPEVALRKRRWVAGTALFSRGKTRI